MPLLLPSMATTLAATCSPVGCKPASIIADVSRSSPSTVIVWAINLPSLSDDPSTFTFSPGIKIVSAISCLSRPKSPLSSLTLVFAFRTTVVLPPEPVTIIVSPERAMIIPLTSSPRLPMANINAGKSTPTSLTPITRCIAVTPFFSFGTRTSMRLSGIRIRSEYFEARLREVTPVYSSIKFHVKSSVAIAGKFDKWEASLTFLSPDETTGALVIKIYADSVDTGSGMKNRKLKGNDFFDVKNYPEITFVSTKIVQTGYETYEVD